MKASDSGPAHLKGEGIRVVPSLLQQRVVHAAQGRLVAVRVDLDLLDPDVLPEAEAHHVQVVAAVAESARQLHKHCTGERGWLFHPDTASSPEPQAPLSPFLSPKSFVSSLTTPSVEGDAHCDKDGMVGGCAVRERRLKESNVPILSTLSTWST